MAGHGAALGEHLATDVAGEGTGEPVGLLVLSKSGRIFVALVADRAAEATRLDEGLLPFSSARQPQTPPAAPRCNPSCISAPRALISAGKTMLLLCSFWTKSALSVPQHLRLVAVGYCGGYL